ncbi:MAG: hypothetical protein ACRD3V_00825 [Vicinamibacteria bacterium]
MGKINSGRVILGGLVAGLVMNVSEAVLHAVVLAEDGAKLLEDWKALGLNVEMAPTLLLWLIGITFVLGILAVWTYAAIRPRFGAGPSTAICAGLAVWAMSYLYAGVYVHAGIVIVPTKLTWLPVVWGLVEIPVATLLGAWLYRE